MKNPSKISTLITSLLAVLILTVSVLSVSVSVETSIPKTQKEEGKNTAKDNNNKTSYFTKTSIEAVFSQLASDFNCEAVVFLPTDFKYLVKEITLRYFRIFERKVHLEILFEHLSAPNAP